MTVKFGSFANISPLLDRQIEELVASAQKVNDELGLTVIEPTAITNLTATGGLGHILLEYAYTNYNGHLYTEVWRSDDNVFANGVRVGATAAKFYRDQPPGALLTDVFYYWVRNVNINGDASDWFGPVNGSVSSSASWNIDDLLGQLGFEHFASGTMPVRIVSALPGLSTTPANWPVGSIVYLTTNQMLYKNENWTWVAVVNTVDLVGEIVEEQVADGAINTAKFAAGIEPVAIVNGLPTAAGYTGAKVVFNTVDGVIYRYIGGAWTKSVASGDITGQLTNAQLEDIATSKLTGTITETQIADNAISTPKIAAGAISTAKLAAGAITAETIAAGAVTATQLAAGSVIAGKVAAGAISASEIASSAITTDKLAADAITADKIAARTITGQEIAVDAITADNLAANSVSSDQLTANSVVAGKIAAGALAVNDGVMQNGYINNAMIQDAAITDAKIVSLTANKITAGTIDANDVTIVNLKVGAHNLAPIMPRWVGILNHPTVGDFGIRLTSLSGYPETEEYYPIDSTRTYKVRFQARPQSGCDGRLYFCLRQYTDTAGTVGPSNSGRSPYKPSGVTVAAHNTTHGVDSWGWYEYTWTPDDWQAGCRYVRPNFLNNYLGTTGYWEIGELYFYEGADSTSDALSSFTEVNSGGLKMTQSGTGNYVQMTPGELEFYENSVLYKALRRVETGVVASGQAVVFSPAFKSVPFVMLSPNDLPTYDNTFSTAIQSLECSPIGLNESGFTARADLTINGSGSILYSFSDVILNDSTVYQYTTQSSVSNVVFRIEPVTGTNGGISATGCALTFAYRVYGSGSAYTTAFSVNYSTTGYKYPEINLPSANRWDIRIISVRNSIYGEVSDGSFGYAYGSCRLGQRREYLGTRTVVQSGTMNYIAIE